ncbi:O-antigen ligase [Caulobacter sp. S45]|uniref:O-antigen ligase family protein n=1 Tax=Caulobacter sp. S45 TaxID=1641861 RepID=UPI00131AD320|nr:O-antigen ligase family protein [Caulobacter sp. S45]
MVPFFEWWFCFFAFNCMLYSYQLQTLTGLGLLGCLVWRVVAAPKVSAQTIFRCWPLLLVPLYAIASTCWSDAPGQTAKLATELMITALLGCLIGGFVDQRKAVSALMAASFLFMTACVLAGARHAGDNALIGIVRSKNAVASVACLLVLSSIAVSVDAQQSRRMRLMGLCGIPLAVATLFLARSAGAVVAAVASAGILFALATLSRVRLEYRVFLVAGLAVALAPIAFVAKTLPAAIQGFAANVLHKDATLTGRTYLWRRAHDYIAARPLLGHGYGAFWRQGSIEAEGLWRALYIKSRMGFNFHNSFIEMLVNLGWSGECLLVLAIMAALVGLLRQLFMRPRPYTAFWLTFLLYVLIRAPTESLLMVQFDTGSMLFFVAGATAFGKVRNLAVAARSRSQSVRRPSAALRPATALHTPSP